MEPIAVRLAPAMTMELDMGFSGDSAVAARRLHDYRAVGAPAANRGIAYLVARGAISNGRSRGVDYFAPLLATHRLAEPAGVAFLTPSARIYSNPALKIRSLETFVIVNWTDVGSIENVPSSAVNGGAKSKVKSDTSNVVLPNSINV